MIVVWDLYDVRMHSSTADCEAYQCRWTVGAGNDIGAQWAILMCINRLSCSDKMCEPCVHDWKSRRVGLFVALVFGTFNSRSSSSDSRFELHFFRPISPAHQILLQQFNNPLHPWGFLGEYDQHCSLCQTIMSNSLDMGTYKMKSDFLTP